MNKIAVTFVLISLLTACTQENTNLNEEVVPPPSPLAQSANTSPAAILTPQSAVSSKEPPQLSTPPSERCDEDGILTVKDEIRALVIQTTPEIGLKGREGSPFLCHHPQKDTIFITNATEVLEFNPNTSVIKTIISSQMTGFSNDKNNALRFQELRECIIDKTGILYLNDSATQEVYRIDLENQSITTLHHTPYGTTDRTYKFEPLIDFALSTEKQVLITDLTRLYRVNGSTVDLLFRSNVSNVPHTSLFPQKITRANGFSASDMTGIIGIAADDKNNVYMTSQVQGALFRLNLSDQELFIVNPSGVNQINQKGAVSYSAYGAGRASNLEYIPKYGIFLSIIILKPSVITRDGCAGILNIQSDNGDPLQLSDFVSTNDGTLYAIESKNRQLVRLEIPPDLPEKAQWEPPQAWKNATGIE